MENLMKSYTTTEDASVIIPITPDKWEELAIELIKKDRNVDLRERLYSNYDDETGSVMTIIDEESISKEESDRLGNLYSFDEWFKTTDSILFKFRTTDSILFKLFGEDANFVGINSPLDAQCQYYELHMPLPVYEKHIKQGGCICKKPVKS